MTGFNWLRDGVDRPIRSDNHGTSVAIQVGAGHMRSCQNGLNVAQLRSLVAHSTKGTFSMCFHICLSATLNLVTLIKNNNIIKWSKNTKN